MSATARGRTHSALIHARDFPANLDRDRLLKAALTRRFRWSSEAFETAGPGRSCPAWATPFGRGLCAGPRLPSRWASGFVWCLWDFVPVGNGRSAMKRNAVIEKAASGFVSSDLPVMVGADAARRWVGNRSFRSPTMGARMTAPGGFQVKDGDPRRCGGADSCCLEDPACGPYRDPCGSSHSVTRIAQRGGAAVHQD
jgi:hypothetical protein